MYIFFLFIPSPYFMMNLSSSQMSLQYIMVLMLPKKNEKQ